MVRRPRTVLRRTPRVRRIHRRTQSTHRSTRIPMGHRQTPPISLRPLRNHHGQRPDHRTLTDLRTRHDRQRTNSSITPAATHMKSPCLDCGTPADDTRCEQCRAPFDRTRYQQQQRDRQANGGRPQYAGAWSTYAKAIRTNATRCWICGQGPKADDPFQADHIVPVSRGGGRGIPTAAPAHRSCNIGRSNKLRAGKPDPAPPQSNRGRQGRTPPASSSGYGTGLDPTQTNNEPTNNP